MATKPPVIVHTSKLSWEKCQISMHCTQCLHIKFDKHNNWRDGLSHATSSFIIYVHMIKKWVYNNHSWGYSWYSLIHELRAYSLWLCHWHKSDLTWFYKCASPWLIPRLDILLEYWIKHVTLGPFMPCLHSLLGYFTGEFQAWQLIVLVVWVPRTNHLPPVCWSTLWKSSLKWE